jgi:hypothetical protein
MTIASDLLWTAYYPGRVFGLPLGRRLTVARGANGQVIVFSPQPFCERIIAELTPLDGPGAFVIPGRRHGVFLPDYFTSFPRAKFLAGKASLDDHPDWPLVELSPGMPELAGFDVIEVEGMPAIREHVFFHRATRSLIVAELLLNIVERNGWLDRTLLQLAGIREQPGPSRLWRMLIKDRARFSASLQRVLELDFQRIIPLHGEVINDRAMPVFQEAFAEWLCRKPISPSATKSPAAMYPRLTT